MQSEEPIEHSLETRKLHEFLTNGWHGGRLDKDEAALSAQLSALANFMIKRHKCRAPMLKVTGLSQDSNGGVSLLHDSSGMTANAGEMTGTQALFALRGVESVQIPLDLRQWFAPGLLVEWVEEIIEKIKAQEPVRTGEVGSMDQSGRAMLGLLGLGYITGVFASSEISEDARMNTPLRLVCGGIFPFRQELSRFRKRHRALLTALMFEVFIRAASEKLGARRATGGPGLHAELLEAARVRLDIASQLDHAD